MKKITGPVFEEVVLACASSGVTGHKEITCLKRANLWDLTSNRPDDRVQALRTAGVSGLERAYAFHRALDRRCFLDDVARETYTKMLTKYRHLLSPRDKPIQRADVTQVLQEWPADWRRLLVGDAGGVPIDSVAVALVALGFDPPKTFEDVFDISRGIPTHSSGSSFEWTLLWCPGSSKPTGFAYKTT